MSYETGVIETTTKDGTELIIKKPVVPKWFDIWFKSLSAGSATTQYQERLAIKKLSDAGMGKGFPDENALNDEFRYVLDNKEELMTAILLGYDVEQPKKYVLETVDPNGTQAILGHTQGNTWVSALHSSAEDLEKTYDSQNSHYHFTDADISKLPKPWQQIVTKVPLSEVRR